MPTRTRLDGCSSYARNDVRRLHRYLYLLAGQEAGNTLMRGFTSVRDMAGPTFGLKPAIDSGTIPGPRVWPSGAMISQTSGHGDFRFAVWDSTTEQ